MIEVAGPRRARNIMEQCSGARTFEEVGWDSRRHCIAAMRFCSMTPVVDPRAARRLVHSLCAELSPVTNLAEVDL